MKLERFTKEFDVMFKGIDIYNQYPILMPFVGNQYNKAQKKVLFIGESHYLPDKYTGVSDINWYDKKLEYYNFDGEAIEWLNTRNIINGVINKWGHAKSHNIFRNIGKVFGEVFQLGSYENSLAYVSFYNYFLRPAEIKGKSIKIEDWNEKILSFEVLEQIYNILKPDKIIFASKLARQSFHQVRWTDEKKEIGEKIEKIVDRVPHPTCQWWNRPSKENNGLTGKEKLIEILKN